MHRIGLIPSSVLRLCRFPTRVRPQMKIVPVPVFEDNYAYLIQDEASGLTAAVDPAEPAKVLAAADSHGMRLCWILTTHKHWDHSGGNEALAKSHPDLAIYGGVHENVPAKTHNVKDGDVLQLGSHIQISVMEAPCHTSGHVLYIARDTQSGQQALFSGDTLFIGGCGRFFEGDGAQMLQNMDRIAQLDDATLVYCGHEYSESNLRFGSDAEPTNGAIQTKLGWAVEMGKSDTPTIPSTVAAEKQHNVFMRVRALMKDDARFAAESPAEAMTKLRKYKDEWKPKP
ncbi:mitochondrial hydroxyacylglutathione hydrolase (glyoxylase II) [Andalucia godoyi]|uniref:hydroxyacylglutathione hydrolase n=1 Tax=Andalucia godoyi TaxID=505711 RepID=A0A8K0F0L1_ANDGO|nr:mitochondrial hydroxyacylglutathione hydrolase (glyoxylase II) [Andalucia godoyi]|eukprot:ANDGO_06158.mRNA.1 mitochondrial hydroxyacylglutathione hydrolase (glyoxylase II)